MKISIAIFCILMFGFLNSSLATETELPELETKQYKMTFYLTLSHANARCSTKLYIDDDYFATIKPNQKKSLNLFNGVYRLKTTLCNWKFNEDVIPFTVNGEDTYIRLYTTYGGYVRVYPTN